jgi:hypothetical protein
MNNGTGEKEDAHWQPLAPQSPEQSFSSLQGCVCSFSSAQQLFLCVVFSQVSFSPHPPLWPQAKTDIDGIAVKANIKVYMVKMEIENFILGLNVFLLILFFLGGGAS